MNYVPVIEIPAPVKVKPVRCVINCKGCGRKTSHNPYYCVNCGRHAGK